MRPRLRPTSNLTTTSRFQKPRQRRLFAGKMKPASVKLRIGQKLKLVISTLSNFMGRVLIIQLLTEVLIPRQLSTEAIRGWTRLFLRITLIRNANDLFRFRCFQIIWARKSSVNRCLCSHRLLLLIIQMPFHRIMITRLMWSRVWLYKMASG